ncbi:MAG: hypothetical protein ACKVX7_07220 [Planctomycetota bacterium]
MWHGIDFVVESICELLGLGAAPETLRARKKILEARLDATEQQCLGCGGEIPTDAIECKACGWTFVDDASTDNAK